MAEIKNKRILHVIDSLNPGGAEQMAINIVNGLAKRGCSTYLLVTHGDGLLHDKIDSRVTLILLKKKGALDVSGFLRMCKIIKENDISVIHAHSSSIYWSSMIRAFNPSIRLIWHDHFGNSEQLSIRPGFALRLLSPLWFHVIAVNQKLLEWSVQKLRMKPEKVTFLNNFAVLSDSNNSTICLPAVVENQINMVCVANLRPQKDHNTLLKAFKVVAGINEKVVLHLVGVDPEDDYSRSIISQISKHNYTNRIFYWGAQKNVASWLNYMHIGVLSSKSEGLPVSLLEYGSAGLQIIATNVGQVADVLKKGEYGKLVPPSSPEQLATAIISVLADETEWDARSVKFAAYLKQNYSEESMLDKLSELYLQ